MARLVVRHRPLLLRLQHVRLLLHARHHPLNGRLKVLQYNTLGQFSAKTTFLFWYLFSKKL
jgi:hypothetical protein